MENIISLAHSGEIRSLSTAVWRPYAVSVGQDRFLFLWNVAAEQIQFSKLLDEDILSASLHPMGHYVAITTSDSLQVFSVLVDRFHLVREVILAGCRKLAFNSGGNYIAVTRGSTLQLINFITFETSSPLMAHKGDVISYLFVWFCQVKLFKSILILDQSNCLEWRWPANLLLRSRRSTLRMGHDESRSADAGETKRNQSNRPGCPFQWPSYCCLCRRRSRWSRRRWAGIT